MNRLPPLSVGNDESADSVKNAVSPEAGPIVQNPSDVGLLIVTGFVAANLVPTLVCRLPQSHTLTWLFLKAKPSFGNLAKKVGIGWLFLPCITLLYRQHSPWMFFVVALATVAVAFSLRPIF